MVRDFRFGLFWHITAALVLSACVIFGQPTSEEEESYLRSALPLIQQRNWSGAENELKEGLTKFPRSALLTNALGMVYEQQGELEAAAGEFEQALKCLPSFSAARIHLATIYGKRGRCEKAVELFNTAASSVSDPGALSAIGTGLGECEAYADAARVLEKAHGLDPSSATITWNMVLAQFKAGAFEQVLASLDALPHGFQPEQAEMLYLRGKAMQALNRREAGSILAEACHTKPEDDYCEDAAIVLVREDRLQEAADLLESELQSQQRSATALATLGLIQFRLGRYRQAIGSYTRAIELDPGLAAPREGLGFLLYMTGDLDKARSTVEDALKRPTQNFYIPYLHALILWRMSHGFGPDALKSIAASLKLNPKFAPAYFLRGKIRFDGNDLNGALADFETASRVDPNYALPWYKMAQVYYRQGRTGEAKNAERQFAKLGNLREEEVLARQAQDALTSSAAQR